MKTTPHNTDTGCKSLRYAIFVPLALMIAAITAGCLSYSAARQDMTDDLNEAMRTLASENNDMWTRHDTISALRLIHTATKKPAIYEASDMNFRYQALKEKAYFTLAVIERNQRAPEISRGMIVSDSIMLIPVGAADGIAIRLQGFADCSPASVLAVSDQRTAGVLFFLSILSMAPVAIWRRRRAASASVAESAAAMIDTIKLTPMQRQLTQMLLDAPGRKVDKNTLCMELWGDKSNAEESLYTLVRRTKTALAGSGIEITCNRGDSYELRINS